MKKQTVKMGNPDVKKHSVRFDAVEEKAVLKSIYIMKEAFDDGKIPAVVYVTLGEE